jgi:ketosteroid isomerase-like protein
MKIVIRTFTLVALFVIAGMVQADDHAKAVVDAYLVAWNAHDAEKAASYFAEDGVYFDATEKAKKGSV